MGFLQWFKKKPEPEPEVPFLEIYTGMRVEVTNEAGRLLFVAKLQGVQDQERLAELRQYSETDLPQEMEEALPVKIRGFSDREKKAVYLEGAILPKPFSIWQVENLVLIKIANDRAFFRLNTNLDAAILPTDQPGGEGESCKLLNISVGGACISETAVRQPGDKFLLRVKLHPEREVSVLLCQVVRFAKIVGKEKLWYEYGCKFLELKDSEQERITQTLFDLQRRKGY